VEGSGALVVSAAVFVAVHSVVVPFGTSTFAQSQPNDAVEGCEPPHANTVPAAIAERSQLMFDAFIMCGPRATTMPADFGYDRRGSGTRRDRRMRAALP
jgi:hypothetical protein